MSRLAVALVVVVGACAHYQPGQGVTPEFAERWGCRYEQVVTAAKQYKAELPAGKVYIPQVGWNACGLLAHNGAPTKVDLQQAAYGRSATWWYHAPNTNEAHMVTLRQDGARWIVDYVGW